MRDHGLFQAICRVNRLHTEDKEYGYIIDYRDLFQSLQTAVHDYTGGAFAEFDKEDVAGLLTNRLDKARRRLDETLEQVRAICEPVPPPRDSAAYLHYFVAADTGDQEAIKGNEPRRVALYKTVARLVRAFANLANEMSEAGYSPAEAEAIRQEAGHYEQVRAEVRLASGDYVDMKMFEPAMRHLLDTYIQAEESQIVAKFEEQGLVDLFVNGGLDALVSALPPGLKSQPEAMTEAIENNVRRLIVDEYPVNPKYYERMSQLLDELIARRKAQAVEYRAYLERLQQLAHRVRHPEVSGGYPPELRTAGQRALYDNTGRDTALALKLDRAIRQARKEGWRGSLFKERELLRAIAGVLSASRAASADGGRVAEPAPAYVITDIIEEARRILEIVQAQDEY